MPLSDYAHHNEEAQRIWWEEEGRHEQEPSEPDDYEMGAADAFAEEMDELEDADLIEEMNWQTTKGNDHAAMICRDLLANRGITV